MSFKGAVEAKCPKGCEPFDAEIWSFIRGDKSPELRLFVLFRECNLIMCPECETAFFPLEPYIYFDPTAELLAFVFPESYREKKEFWLQKMHDDFVILKQTIGEGISLVIEPQIFFGQEELALVLEKDDYCGEEREVMEAIASDLGLVLYRVSPSFARQNEIPGALPYVPAPGGAVGKEGVIRGLEKVIAVNDRLTSFDAYLRWLKSSPDAGLPPASIVKSN